MRLSFALAGDEVVGAIEAGALSIKRTLPYPARRVAELSEEVVRLLQRGNRAHSLGESVQQSLRQVGQQLAALLLPPEIAQRLPEGDSPVYLQVDESLVAVPWEMLHDGERFWCQRFDLGRAVVTPQAMVGRPAVIPTVGPLRMLTICADPRGDLGQAMREVETLVDRLDATAKRLEARLLVDPTVETVRRALVEHDLVHFAGHAEHEPDHPERSGWLLADGRLTAADVVGLSGQRLPLLVFSNACRSGETAAWRGRPDQIYGMANAFLLGGVRLYLGTQWEVVDAQGADFAHAFYQALGRGANAGTAVRCARQQQLRTHGSQAVAWAAYVLYGDPRIAPLQPVEGSGLLAIPSASQLKTHRAAPWKRPRGQGPRAQPRRLWVLIAGLLIAAALGFALWLRPQAPQGGADPAGAGAGPLEPRDEGQPVPLVAVLLDEPLRECLAAPLQTSARFRTVDPRQVAQLTAAEQLALDRPNTADRAVALAEALHAELVLFRAPGQQLAAADALTGQLLARWPTTTVCDAAVEELVRVVHGEGRVVAVEGARVFVDIGWRSRVVPGATLELLSDGGAAGTLEVVSVEMERCVARGRAVEGQRVRLRR